MEIKNIRNITKDSNKILKIIKTTSSEFLPQEISLIKTTKELEAWYQRLIENQGILQKVLVGAEIIGFLIKVAFENIVYLGYVIDLNFQGKGYGTKLIALVINDLETTQFEKIHASVVNQNIGSIRILEKNNFQLVKKDPIMITLEYEL